jgi:hypothetical protein
LIDTSAGTAFSYTWSGCTSLTSFPLLDFTAATSLIRTRQGCSGLTSFPLIVVPVCTSFFVTWYGCTGLTSFPLIVFSGVTTFGYTWYNCTGLNAYDFPLINMHAMTSGGFCFYGVTLSTTSWSNLLINIEANNSNTGVAFHGGTSLYNVAGGVARADLIADHTWTITDGGAA